MKAKSMVLCALVLLASSAPLGAQKTEVTVRQGKVLAETQTATVSVDAGQKAVLKKDANPFGTVDSPLVQDALELYKLVEEEREHGELKIDSVFIAVGKTDEDEVVGAIYWEIPNAMPKATNIMTIPYSSTLGDIRVYDLDGNLCKVEERSLGDFAFSFNIHFLEQVQPGEHFKFIAVTRLDDIGMPVFPGGARIAWKEGPLAYFRVSPGYPNALQYFRFILPESAILVDANREIVATDTVDGNLAVTLRNYTGPYSDAMCMIALLYPDEDGTTHADIPGKYRGLRSEWDKENSEMYQREMHKIRAGIKYADQSTPLAALLTAFSSAMNGDTDLYAAVAYRDYSPDQIQGYVENSKYWADRLDVLSTPQWPRTPGNGYVHPIHLCRKGSLIDEIVQRMVHEDGKWYSHSGIFKQAVDSEHATSQDLATAKRKGYLSDWQVAGPYVQKGKTHRELFDIPFGPELSDVDVPWHSAKVEPHEEHPASVDISSVLLPMDQSAAYLRTEIASDRQKLARLEIYTDDGVKAWLNGELICEENNSWGISEQPDAVNVTLEQGVNHLMLKVTEDSGGSRAIVRIGSDRAAGPRPTDKAIDPTPEVQLDWTPALTAQSHRVYFGTDQNNLSLLAEIFEVRELEPLSLDPGQRYFWRVDEILGDGSSIQGDVWSFSTGL
ncbi:MAG: fibronectin type III domain-containing protein [Sedimentisphaerales bacterium]|nr:fibronectin type III domain-containing protein [Sedimentisphaerales bacterium]